MEDKLPPVEEASNAGSFDIESDCLPGFDESWILPDRLPEFAFSAEALFILKTYHRLPVCLRMTMKAGISHLREMGKQMPKEKRKVWIEEWKPLAAKMETELEERKQTQADPLVKAYCESIFGPFSITPSSDVPSADVSVTRDLGAPLLESSSTPSWWTDYWLAFD
ncbi:hypothetical protein JCM5350_007033 [Sporobolomyces pararoseus]